MVVKVGDILQDRHTSSLQVKIIKIIKNKYFFELTKDCNHIYLKGYKYNMVTKDMGRFWNKVKSASARKSISWL